MKHLSSILATLVATIALLGSCNSATVGTAQQAAGGAPYELIAVVAQPQWESEVGDTLREIFAEPVMYVNEYEPRFDLMR